MVHPDRTVGSSQIDTIPCFKRSNLLESTEEQPDLPKDCETDQSGEVKPQGKKRCDRTNVEENSSEVNVKRIKKEEEVAEEEGGKHCGI